MSIFLPQGKRVPKYEEIRCSEGCGASTRALIRHHVSKYTCSDCYKERRERWKRQGLARVFTR